MGETTAQERIDRVKALTESYFEYTGHHVSNAILGRLATLILWDDLNDATPYKVQNTEYPIPSERQDEDYYRGLTMRKVPETIGADGVNYARQR